MHSYGNEYINTKKKIIKILLSNGWNAYDIRKCQHIKYNSRDKLLSDYEEKNKLKINAYLKTEKLYLFDKKWWMKYNNINNNNDETKLLFITFQKQLIDNKEIHQLINHGMNNLPKELHHKYQIYYKYQPNLLQSIYKDG